MVTSDKQVASFPGGTRCSLIPARRWVARNSGVAKELLVVGRESKVGVLKLLPHERT